MHLQVNISRLKGAAVIEGSAWASLYCNEYAMELITVFLDCFT